jgi:hypothetical protein
MASVKQHINEGKILSALSDARIEEVAETTPPVESTTLFLCSY